MQVCTQSASVRQGKVKIPLTKAQGVKTSLNTFEIFETFKSGKNSSSEGLTPSIWKGVMENLDGR
jgi:hypothetical protein